ncbi:MAG TPA: triose-phosphate isomerase [Gemmatimonadaceae bacterium]
MQTPVFAANWKMHHGPSAGREFVKKFTALYEKRGDRTVILCPQAVAIDAVAAALSDRTDIGVGVQNIWTEPKGAFTGECSASMAKEAGASYVLVGHSERRHVFGETNEQTALKCVRAFEGSLIPILCVGEKIDQREAGATENVVTLQLRAGLSKLSPSQVQSILIAYEPVWAIGTGKTATPSDAAAVHAVIRRILSEVIGGAAAKRPILYGGSVNEGNAASLLAAEGVDGLLVGGASLDAATWARICQA